MAPTGCHLVLPGHMQHLQVLVVECARVCGHLWAVVQKPMGPTFFRVESRM